MGDDLDDLLDEVEDQFFKEASPRTSAVQENNSNSLKRSSSDDNADLDQIISDICSDDVDLSAQTSRDKLKHSSKVAGGKTNSKRCFPILLGGSHVTMGNSDSTSQRACDQLRCTSCDFHVIWFDDHVWHSKSDYLFFRNNVPDRDKLKKYLVRKKGQRAYACQCSWHHVMGVVDLSTLPRLKWVCGKH